MKKFFTIVPLQGRPTETRPGFLKPCTYTAQGNQHLIQGATKRETHFPIVPTIAGYAKAGETIQVIAVGDVDNEDVAYNLGLLKAEVATVQAENGFTLRNGDVTFEGLSSDQGVDTQIDNFQKMLDYMEEGDELFLCITFGTKVQTLGLKLAVQYGYRILKDTSIGCVVYGQLDRSQTPPVSRLYDETALLQMDELLHSLAERQVKNPKEMLKTIIEL